MRTHTLGFMGSIAALLLAATPAGADSYGDDRAKIEDLQARYMFAMDFKDADTYASCFAQDGVLDYAGGVEKGRDAIRAFINKARATEAEKLAKDKSGLRPARSRHNITNIVLKIEGNKATGRAYWVSLSNDNEKRTGFISGYGHYEDELVKQNGEWLFTKRKIFNEILERRGAPAQSPAW